MIRAVGMLAGGIMIIVALCCFTGLIIYATYYDCDPLVTEVKHCNIMIIKFELVRSGCIHFGPEYYVLAIIFKLYL